jgi:hypothetical protein
MGLNCMWPLIMRDSSPLKKKGVPMAAERTPEAGGEKQGLGLFRRRWATGTSRMPGILFVLLLGIWSNPPPGHGQVMGERAEMDRLEQRAEELAAQADAEGAAQTIGKAAMMAEFLTKDAPTPSERNTFQAASLVYRAQEQGLRALALFERTGGVPPAPSGVCHFLTQSEQKLRESNDLLAHHPIDSKEDMQERRRHLSEKIEEWGQLLQGIKEDVHCTGSFSHSE